jgi:hypothetical protein
LYDINGEPQLPFFRRKEMMIASILDFQLN